MNIDPEVHQKKKQIIASMEMERLPFWQHWRTLSDYYLPSRYVSLETDKERRISRRNDNILDATGTLASSVLSSGMMNGITSPTRPWFKLRIRKRGREQVPSPQPDDFESDPIISAWTDEVERDMLRVMAESNFYQSMGMIYIDLSVFATACALIYESDEKVIWCQNPPLGEYYLQHGAEHRVDHLSRQFTHKVFQLVDEFGEANVSDTVRNAYRQNDAGRLRDVDVIHLIEPNYEDGLDVGRGFRYRELFWEKSGPVGTVLRLRGWKDFPAITPRWSLSGNDTYGTDSPGMIALGDVIQLQFETKRKAQGIDKLVSPPVLADASLRNKPTALLPNGITYVPRLDASNGARPIYTVNPPIGEMTADIREIQARIREIFHNDLFQMISNLDTVRSAAEIDARREEKLVLLGPVLERFESEALDPTIERIYSIMDRKQLLPQAPPQIRGRPLEIQYVSILSAAQSAVGTAPTERFLQLVGNMVQIWPEAKEVPNVPELLRDYARDIGVKGKNIRPRQDSDQSVNAANQNAAVDSGLARVQNAAAAAKLLSETDVGGGANALQQVIGG